MKLIKKLRDKSIEKFSNQICSQLRHKEQAVPLKIK